MAESDPRRLVARGMDQYKKGLVAESVADFDQFILAFPSKRPYMWQRGLSLYYLDRFDDAAHQFAIDVEVNPDDTEESIWHFLSVVRGLRGKMTAQAAVTHARSKILRVGRDSRAVMRTAMALFDGSGSTQELDTAGGTTQGSKARFYADLYLGLWAEACGEEGKAEAFIAQAARSSYAKTADPDYMCYVAVVHCGVRGWVFASAKTPVESAASSPQLPTETAQASPKSDS